MKPKGANFTPSFEVLHTAHSVEGNALGESLKKKSGVLRGKTGYGVPAVLGILVFLKA